MCMEHLIDISKALLTPIIAIVTTYIAWQQWKTNQQKLNLEKYDRRLHVYERVKEILSIVLRENRVSREALINYRLSVSEADFLFGSEIIEYIDEIYQHGLDLDLLYESTQHRSEGYDHNNVADKRHDELAWFTEQFKLAKEKFRKYLDLSK
jgi:hypothetical protein